MSHFGNETIIGLFLYIILNFVFSQVATVQNQDDCLHDIYIFDHVPNLIFVNPLVLLRCFPDSFRILPFQKAFFRTDFVRYLLPFWKI